MEFKSFKELVELVKGKSNRVVVPGANNHEALSAIKMADEKGLISSGILIGDVALVKHTMKEVGLAEDKFEFIPNDKKELVTKKIESLNKEIEKLMKSL